MTATLPGRPHLAHLRKQAKQLLSAHRRGEAAATSRFSQSLPGFRSGASLALHDAQSVVAREYGFESWLKLRDEVRVRVAIPHGEPAYVILVPPAGGHVRPADRHINRVIFAPDGDVLVSAGMDGRIRVWRTGEWDSVSELQAHARSANTLSFHPDGTLLTTGSSDGTAKVWSWPGLEIVAELPAKLGAASNFSPLGDRILTHGLNGRPYLWSWPECERIGEIRAHPKKATTHAFTPDGEQLITSGLEGGVAITQLSDGELVRTHAFSTSPIVSVGFVPGSYRLVLTEYGGRLSLVDCPDLSTVAESALGAAGMFTLSFHPSEDVFAMCVDHGVQLRSTADLGLLETLGIPAKGVYTLAFSADDRWLAVAGADQRIRIWAMTG